MGAGIVWAVIAFAVCRKTHRGLRFTAAATGAAWLCGAALELVTSSSAAPALGPLLLGLEIALVLAGAGAAVLVIQYRPHQHGSSAIASTRHVIYLDPVGKERKRIRSSTDPHSRIRPRGGLR